MDLRNHDRRKKKLHLNHAAEELIVSITECMRRQEQYREKALPKVARYNSAAATPRVPRPEVPAVVPAPYSTLALKSRGF